MCGYNSSCYYLDEDPPADFSIYQMNSECIRVSWTPAPSAQNTTTYVIYYETDDFNSSVSVQSLSTSYVLVGLEFGSTYSVSIAAQSDFQSPTIGPKILTLGKLWPRLKA